MYNILLFENKNNLLIMIWIGILYIIKNFNLLIILFIDYLESNKMIKILIKLHF